MLLSAGYSLGGALNRVAARGRGCCARDLERVCRRVRQGLDEVDALREWAAVADVAALHRLVPVLALNREASDLGRLLSEEARSVRHDVHRAQLEAIERRSQQVWVPVTVAALVPGVVFVAIPFVAALRMYAAS
jgi:Flp pilus assembly protein TadB